MMEGVKIIATGQEISEAGFKYIGTPYSVMDCQAFVEKCLADCGIRKDLAGSNAWYRYIMANGWVGTPEECRSHFGYMPLGVFLFVQKDDGGEPGKYRGDGIGNVNHIGIYTSTGKGAINSSSSNGCVCESSFKGKSIRGGWNRVGLWKQISYGESIDRILHGGGGGTMVNYQAMVIGGYLRLRDEPNEHADLICRIPDRTIITITEEFGDWGCTSFGGKTGWVMLKYTERMDAGQLPDGSGEMISVSKSELEHIYDQLGDWLGLRG